MHFFVFVILKICHAQKPCTLSPMRINYSVAENFAKQYKMESSSSEDDFVALLKKRKRKRKYRVLPILRLRREEGEFHLLIKELRDYPEWFKVYFRMSVAQFDALLAICLYIPSLCIPHIVCHTVLCAARWSGSTCQTPFWILAFACTVAVNCLNTSQNVCYGCKKRRKFNPIQKMLWQTKVLKAVCKRDWHNVRLYLFFNVQTFWTRILDSRSLHIESEIFKCVFPYSSS